MVSVTGVHKVKLDLDVLQPRIEQSYRDMRSLRHKIHMGLFAAFGLHAFNWIVLHHLLEIAQPIYCTTLDVTNFFQLTKFYWMFLEGFYLFLQVHSTGVSRS